MGGAEAVALVAEVAGKMVARVETKTMKDMESRRRATRNEAAKNWIGPLSRAASWKQNNVLEKCKIVCVLEPFSNCQAALQLPSRRQSTPGSVRLMPCCSQAADSNNLS